MSEWPMVKLGEVARVVAGGTPKTSVLEYWDGDIPWVTPKDLALSESLWINAGERFITDYGLAKSAAALLPRGTVLWSSRAPIGLVAIANNQIATNQGFKSFVPGGELDSEYLAYFLIHQRPILEMMGVGATFKEVSAKRAAEIMVPLPPLGEQKRIAEILGGVSKAIQKTKVQLLLMDSLGENKYLSLSKDADTFKSLKDLGVKKITGKSIVAKPDNEHDVNQIIKVSAVSSGRFIASEAKPLPADYEPNNLHEIHQGDLLFARASGSANLLGACCIVDKEIQHLYLPDKVWKLEVDEDILPKVYLLQALRGREFRSVAESHFSSSTGVKNIKTSVLMEFKIPVLKQGQFNDYVHFVKTLDNLRHLLHRKLSLLQELQKSLASRAFAGLL
ncbi:restriction endonuclease subunit S [Corynebacterium matruchotii]|uniref:restriction endonuclease subunit S n=1 Tax=Corynebacterium matruchotii TaxID=43768 RepID=UPI0028EFE72D|nr:restriction endonuclease subunit S [Corynebacterium matruchotii]